MTNAYEFLIDETAVRAFAKSVLKPLQDDECYLVFLAARNKYLTPEQQGVHKLTGADMLARQVLRQKKEHLPMDELLVRAIKRLSVPEGYYKCAGGEPIPFNAFTMFVTINPRDMRKAALEFSLETVKLLSGDSHFENLETRLYSAIHSHCSRKIYLDLDVDYKGLLTVGVKDGILESVKEPLGSTSLKQVVTKNGFHLLIELDCVTPDVRATFYRGVMERAEFAKRLGLPYEIEIKNDSMTPIPGCTQGGGIPFLREV
jgi:hypothetical protein